MKPEEHNRTLGLLHIVYGSLQSLLMLGMILFFLIVVPLTRNPSRGGAVPVAFFAMIMALIVFFQALFTIPSFVAGYGLLKQKNWAKTAGIIAGVLAAISFPHGTALCVYTMWFLFGENGKALYDRTAYRTPPMPDALHAASAQSEWSSHTAARERERGYVPPKQPPDWRQS